VAITFEYPVGRPITLIGKALEERLTFQEEGLFDKETQRYCLGLVHCTILPPDSLFLPLLPVTIEKKLMFSLCATCARLKTRRLCKHSNEKRQFTDVWTASEVCYALKRGYRLIHFHEALIYVERAPIFRDFYAELARLKIQSEPIPKRNDKANGEKGEEQEEEEEVEERLLNAFIELLNREMPWLNLSKEGMRENPGLRAFAKLCLNAALGKLSQNEQKKTLVWVRNWIDLSRLRYDPKLELCSIRPIHDTLAEVVYQKKVCYNGLQKNSNVICYAHVTSYARQVMLEHALTFMKRGCKLFYTDTDSLILDVETKDEEALIRDFSIGSPSFGYFKKETKGDITFFCSIGCKNYCFSTDKDENVVKVRGFQLSSKESRRVLNQETMREMAESLLKGAQREKTMRQFNMKVNRQNMEIRNTILKKRYTNSTFDKRFIPEKGVDLNVGESVAYGCKHLQYADCKQ
jgi:hypothetical protein